MNTPKEKLIMTFFLILASMFISLVWIAAFFNLIGRDIHDVINMIQKYEYVSK